MMRYTRGLQRAFGRSEDPQESDRRRVEARLPRDVADALGPDVEHQLRDLFTARGRQLGLKHPPTVTVTAANSAAVTVAIGGRPLAAGVIAPRNGDGQASYAERAELVVDSVDRALRRRLSLLLGDTDGNELRPVLGHLLDHGVSLTGVADAPEVRRQPPEASNGIPAAEQAELLLERLAPPVLELEISSRTLRRVAEGQDDVLVRARETFFARRGVQYPDLRLIPVDGGTAAVRLNHVRVPMQPLDDAAGWPDAVAALQRTVDEHAHWFVRMSDVVTALGRLSYLGPDLVAMATDRYPMTTLTACLRELVRDAESIRNLPRILWLLLELGRVSGGRDRVRLSEAPLPTTQGSGSRIQRDPIILASGVRKAIAEDRWRAGRHGAARVDGGRLPATVETALMDASDPAALADAEWRALAAYQALGRPTPVITRSTAALRAVRDVLQALPRPPKVVASQELPPDVALPA